MKERSERDSVMKCAEIHLPYYKQGDDLAMQLERASGVPEALEAHADQLVDAADMLRSIQTIVADQPVYIGADTHMIRIEGPESVIDQLIAADLAVEEDSDDVDA